MDRVQDWPELTKALSADLRELRMGAPEVMKAFGSLAVTASAAKALVSEPDALAATQL